MEIITECKMPDISHLREEHALSRYLLVALVSKVSPDKITYDLLLKTYCRLVDKAIYEYCCAREEVINEINEPKRPLKELQKGRQIYLHLIVNHLENCINALWRLLDIVPRIQASRNTSQLDRTIWLC